MESLVTPLRPDRREVLPSMATTPSGTPVTAATQAAKQPWNCSASSVAGMSPRWSCARRAVLERTEAAQQRELLGPEQRDLGEALCTRQHRKQTQQQDLIERIGNLALLARVLEVFEIPQKDNRLVECRTVRSAVHGRRPSCESEDRHGFSTSDVCHALLHPIALGMAPGALAQLWVSGQLPLGPDGTLAERHKGKLAPDSAIETAREAAEGCAINVLGQA